MCRMRARGARKTPMQEGGKLNCADEGPVSKHNFSTQGPSKSEEYGPKAARVMIKKDTPMLWLYLGKKKVYALVDSGADISLISRETFDKIAAKNKFEFSTKDCVPLQTASGQRIKILEL